MIVVTLLSSVLVFAESGKEAREPKRPHDHKLICVSTDGKDTKQDSARDKEKCSVTGKPQPADRPAPGDARRM